MAQNIYIFSVLQIPVISFYVNVMNPHVDAMIGSIDFPSFVPQLTAGLTHPMTFWGRTKNVLTGIFNNLLMEAYLNPMWVFLHRRNFINFSRIIKTTRHFRYFGHWLISEICMFYTGIFKWKYITISLHLAISIPLVNKDKNILIFL